MRSHIIQINKTAIVWANDAEEAVRVATRRDQILSFSSPRVKVIDTKIIAIGAEEIQQSTREGE
jgi:hypothetical protein